MVDQFSRFREFRPGIESLQLSDSYERSDLLVPQFLLDGDSGLEIYYAPFDYINTQGRVALIGVTPGWTQMHRSFLVARAQIEQGATESEILREAKRVAAFSGTLRRNLVTMLDDIALPNALDVSSSSVLFEPDGEHLLHSTSAIRYPVFKKGDNYSGRKPFITKPALFEKYLEELAIELDAVPDALAIPLGKSVEAVLQQLVDKGQLDESRVMFGFPHPSGANPHRPRLFEENRQAMTRTIATWATNGTST